ncbi:MAG: DUF4255 domain-containing protein [Exilibacterium sp.]
MSSPLAIAAVTAVIKDLLNDGLLNHDLSSIGSFSVTATPPDRVTTGQTEPNQLNLFLYQVTPNVGWRNADMPARDGAGNRLSNPPLALDLHYLLSAYGAEDLNAEILLGYAMQLLHDTPVITREKLRVTLGQPALVDGSMLPSPFGELSAVDLADQIEMVKLTPVYLSAEELSKMWTAMQARYRPTMAYMASVVLIQSAHPVSVAPPVLKRGAEDRGPVASAVPAPTLNAASAAASALLPAVRLGDLVRVTGSNLQQAGITAALFEHSTLTLSQELAVPDASSTSVLEFELPSIAEDAEAMHEWAIGNYRLSLQVNREDTPPWSTNSVALTLAPVISIAPLNTTSGDVNLTLTCIPRIRPEQEAQVKLIFGRRAILPATITTPANPLQSSTLEFNIAGVVAGEYLVRLRVDGIDSLAVVLTENGTLEFDPQQKVTVV